MSARDETHKSLRYRLGELPHDSTDHVLPLTATLHKVDPQNSMLFLQLLDRDAYADVHSIHVKGWSFRVATWPDEKITAASRPRMRIATSANR